MQPRLSLLLCGLTLLAACHRGGIQPLTPVPSDQRVYYNDGPAIKDSVRAIVRDTEMWRTLWTRATSTQPAPPPLPAVDFDHEMIVVVGAGRMTPGDQIHVDSTGVQGEYFVVWARTIQACRRFTAEAFPLEIVRVKRSDKAGRFYVTRERGATCS
jgi:hypothetical protein